MLVPYDGYLMIGSTAMVGQRDITFELWDDPTSTDTANLVWSEVQTVDFYNGRFSVGLGLNTAISTTILDAEQLYLAMQVKDDSGAYVALDGRQAIEPVPYAAWSASSANFTIAGDLSVEKNATVAGTAAVTGATTLGGGLAITGATTMASGLDVTGGLMSGQCPRVKGARTSRCVGEPANAQHETRISARDMLGLALAIVDMSEKIG